MKIKVNGVFRPPITVEEYFTILYCEKREFVPSKTRQTRDCKNVWKSLTSAEKKVFIDKFEKWQAEHNKKITAILEYAEPFLKKKTNAKRGNTESNLNETKNECDDKLSTHTIDDTSNSYSEVSKHENLNIEFYMDDYDDNQSESLMNLVYDDTSNATLEVSKPSTSVIDEDIDEPAAPEEINEPTTEKLAEPTPLPLINSRELFEIIKSSGTRPHLATVEWKDLSRSQRYPWKAALTAIRKQYLVKYREYLESLSNPELFKHYNKFKMGY